MVAKKKVCKDCQYWREHSAISVDIAGTGNWCSNSQSPKYRMRAAEGETCAKFSERGKKAPLWMRALKKVVKK